MLEGILCSVGASWLSLRSRLFAGARHPAGFQQLLGELVDAIMSKSRKAGLASDLKELVQQLQSLPAMDKRPDMAGLGLALRKFVEGLWAASAFRRQWPWRIS